MKKLIIYIAVLASVISTGCFKEPIELDLSSSTQRLVVDAWITDLPNEQAIYLSLTSDYFDSFEPTYIDDAIVTLSNRFESVDLIFQEKGKYTLPSNWEAMINEDYELEINYGSVIYQSSAKMNVMPEIENVRVEVFEEDSLELYDVYFDFWENEGEGDGYYGVDYLKGTTNGDTLFNGDFTNDDFLDGLYFQDVTVTNEGHELGDTVVLELYSIGKDAADYLQAIGNEVFRQGLFDPAPVNVPSNISNDALGYFIIGGAQKIEVVVQ